MFERIHGRLGRSIMYGTIVLIILCICITVGYFVYWSCIAPLWSEFFVPNNYIYTGLKYYEDGSYIDFQNGSDFHQFIQTWDVGSKGELIDFYYIDNCKMDNPVYGISSDIYAIDIQMDETEYKAEKMALLLYRANDKVDYYVRDYATYVLPSNLKSDGFLKIIAFCDEDCVVRYVFVTNIDTIAGYDQVLKRRSTLIWEAD